MRRRLLASSFKLSSPFLLLSLLTASPAGAQGPSPTQPPSAAQTRPEEGKAFFDRGVKQYNLGRFAEAIAEFEQAYDKDPAPILLFNIAQSHRQTGNKERALFFYRRYLEQAPDAPNRSDVEQRMADLTQQLQAEKELKQKPPTEVAAAGSTGVPVAVVATTTTTAQSPTVNVQPSWAVAGYVAPSIVSLSGRAVDLPVLFSLRVGASHLFSLPVGTIGVGVDGLLSLLPYTTDEATPRNSTSSLVGFLATGRFVHAFTPKLAGGADVGAGVLWWSGLGPNNPFVDSTVAITGAIPMPTFEVGLRGELELSRGLFVAMAPRVLYSVTTSGLSDSFGGVWRFDLNLGVGYRF